MLEEIAAYRILAIIPARGGSKRLPQKNIKYLAGKPLIAWTIETALNTPCLERIIVSTDDPDIAEIAKKYNAEVPFLRPVEIAQDDTTDLPVYLHVLDWCAENENYVPDLVAWLRPTAPLRLVEDIEGAVEKLIRTGADWVRSVCRVDHHPYWTYRLEGDRMLPFVEGIDINKFMRHQLLPPVYHLNGSVDVAWSKTLTEKGLLYCGDMRAYEMPQNRSIDVDTETDLELAEIMIKRREHNRNQAGLINT